MLFELDDGWTSMPVVITANLVSEADFSAFLGRSVRFVGKLSRFRDIVQVKADKITFVSFAEELAFWVDVQTYWKDAIARLCDAIHPEPLYCSPPENALPCPCCCHENEGLSNSQPSPFASSSRECGRVRHSGSMTAWPRMFSRFVQMAKTVLRRFPDACDNDINHAFSLKQRKTSLPLRCISKCAVAFAKTELNDALGN